MAAAGLLFGLIVLWLRVGWLQVVRHAHYGSGPTDCRSIACCSGQCAATCWTVVDGCWRAI